MFSLRRTLSALILSVLAGSAGFAQETGLPGNATSLTETHRDWTVTCSTPEGMSLCAISQTQVNSQSGQRVLAIELTVAEGGNAASGTLVLPFGLNLDQGVVLSIDEREFPAPLRFSTCLPAGCLVPLIYSQDAVSAMRVGSVLNVRTAAHGNGQEVNFSISLSGFTSALARAAELSAA